MTIRHFAICFHREMTAETACYPRCMTGVAGHIIVAVCQQIFVHRRIAPCFVVFLHRFGVSRFFVVIAISGRDGVGGLFNLPPKFGINDRILHDVAFFQFDLIAVFILAFRIAADNFQNILAFAVGRTKTQSCQILSRSRLVGFFAAVQSDFHSSAVERQIRW